jgi:hypothetical protein
MSSSKVVYVLGAGFSMPAGGLGQERILQEIVDSEFDGDPHAIERREQLMTFLRETLNVRKEDVRVLTLEDVYTPIDRCLADHVSFRGRSQRELEHIRNDLDFLITKVIEQAFAVPRNSNPYVVRFADFLVDRAAERANIAAGATNADDVKAYDPFSIISLNWDILLDNAIHESLDRERQNRGCGTEDYEPFGVVDYCCYVSSLVDANRRIRTGLWSLGARGYNVKLLKMHGSMNWLQCSHCQRLFTDFGEKLVVYRIGEHCRHCQNHGVDAPLRSALIMPTFLKDFSNFQHKLVWQNAGVELMEARRLIFIGYSLPHADFEFRQLITRMVHPSATIDVVLWKDAPKFKDEVARYEQFFAGHKVSVEPGGVLDFVEKHLSGAC